MPQVTIVFRPFDRSISVAEGSTILSAIRAAGILFESVCGGKGQCGKCRVIYESGSIRELGDACTKLLTPEERERGYCLACVTTVDSDAEFTIPVESRIDRPQILVSAGAKPPELNPAARKYFLKVGEPGVAGHPGRSIRLEGYRGMRPAMSPGIAVDLHQWEGLHTATITRSGGTPEIIAIEHRDTTPAQYGIAVDLGTTTIAGLLVDLVTGDILSQASTLNRQITYGEELISRIVVARTREGLAMLRSVAVESINTIITGFLRSGQIRREDVIDLCMSGNTVMTYLFTGKDPAPLELAGAAVGRAPIRMKAADAGIGVHPEAWVTCLPCVSRFVGGDAVGDVLVSGMARSGDLSLLIDLGTNGEIVLGNSDWLASTSCASGPAFEGAGLRCGIRAMHGAIEHVGISPETGEAWVQVIGGGRPKGICGSGIIDAAAGMAAAGIIDFTGLIVESRPFVRSGADGPEYVIVPADRSGSGQDIVITQRDMQYLMDSKAAACGGVRVLMKKYRVSADEVRHVYLAGAFGTYGNRENLTQFGIIPEFPNAEFHLLGNGSLAGAYAALMSWDARCEAEAIAKSMTYIDLLVDPDFVEEYSAALRIPGKHG